MQKYYQNGTQFNGIYSRKHLPKIKDGEYVNNFDEHKSVGNYQMTLYVNGNNATYFDSFGVEYIPKETKSLQVIKIS